MKSTLTGCRIAAIAAVPGSELRRMGDEVHLYGGDASRIDRIRKALGLDARRVAAAGVTALDLCETAARAVLEGHDTMAVDAVIFVTQSPDHSQPCNAALLHGRLGLPSTVAAWDINLGCSGYIYGLSSAWTLFRGSDVRSVLLCAGDTLSRVVNPCDKATAPLFGDAGTATLLVRDDSAAAACFDLRTDGSGAAHLIVPAGGARRPSDAETKTVVTDSDGNSRCAENLHMNGAEVFNFTLRDVPPVIASVREMAGWSVADVDALVCHQANRFVVNNLGKMAGFPAEKVPADICGRYGNQSSASIPFTLCHALSAKIVGDVSSRLVLCGFGVGLSWGAVALTLGELRSASVVDASAGPDSTSV